MRSGHPPSLEGAIEKLADLKLKGPATSMLLAISEAIGPQYVALQLHKKAAAHKNPKVGTQPKVAATHKR